MKNLRIGIHRVKCLSREHPEPVNQGLKPTGNCSELILSAAQLDYMADYDLDYMKIEAALG